MSDAVKSISDLLKRKEDDPSRKNVLIGCTGSVASLKLPSLVEELCKFSNVRIVSTNNAEHFFDSSAVRAHIYRDSDEWEAWKTRGDPVLHIELRRWADLYLIAPLDANTLAKLAGGLCDNLLTCVARAWDMHRPLLFAPAMNTHMWEHPLTMQHVHQLTNFGYHYIPVVEKMLVCGDKGDGGMADVSTIVKAVQDQLYI